MKNTWETQGQRIRFLRGMSSLTRREFSEKYGLKESTFRSWEMDLAVISETSIQKLMNVLRKEGIFCTPDWIRTGIGNPPYIFRNKIFGSKDEDEISNQNTLDIEIKYFLNSYSNSLIYFVQDDCNLPIYKPGDVVGGIKITFPEKIKDYEGQPCIVPDPENKNNYNLRMIKPSKDKDKVSLTCLRSDTDTVACKILYDVTLDFYVPIIWHRRFY